MGDYLIWNEALRRVTSAISVGDALTNSNTTLTNSGKELSQINTNLTETVNSLSGLHFKQIIIPNITINTGEDKNISLASYLPSNITDFEIVSARLSNYQLPYFEPNNANHTTIVLINEGNKSIQLHNSASKWTNYTFYLMVAYTIS